MNEEFSLVLSSGITVRGIFQHGLATVKSVTHPNGAAASGTGIYAATLITELNDLYGAATEDGIGSAAQVEV